MSNSLRAEIYEIQAILYLILAQLVQTDWIMWVIRVWVLVTFIQAMGLHSKSEKE